ncbi:MAG: response regulator transcription factor [Oscillospiraceae bacterium]|nr:response regulator transcription factor [Oscillospiraceae bacterium]MBQ8978147.1 response regulator transcription factor [Oscillospiraceae bacterium]
MSKILIVEDDTQLARYEELELRHEGYEVEKCPDGRQAIDLITAGGIDIIILDIMLPGLNGLEVLRRIRRDGINTPVIMLTARDAVMDKVSGLDMGANDYLTKPFAIEELLARIRALLRIPQAAEVSRSDIISYEGIEMDTGKHTVSVNGTPIELTLKEYGLLEALLENKSIVLSREQLLEKVWGYDYFGETNVVDVYIRYLRQKLEAVTPKKYIQTVRGVGYKIGE